MKRLSDLLAVLPRYDLVGPDDTRITGLQYRLDDLDPGEMFVAIPDHIDGHDRIGRAVAAGASAILCQRVPGTPLPGVAHVVVPDPVAATIPTISPPS